MWSDRSYHLRFGGVKLRIDDSDRESQGAPTFRPGTAGPVADGIYNQVLAEIESGRLEPNTRLPSERELMQQFAAGRSSVREALRALALAGLVEIRPGSGTYVRDRGASIGQSSYHALALALERDAVQHLTEAREFLESGAARLAALRHTAGDLQDLAAAVERMRAAAERADEELFSGADAEFHLQLAKATNNPVVVRMYQDIGELLVKSFHRSNADVTTLRAAADRHARILAAVESGDPRRASTAALKNLSVANRLLDNAYAVNGSPPTQGI